MRRTKPAAVAIANRQKMLRLDPTAVRRLVRAVLPLPPLREARLPHELSLAFVSDDEMALLNQTFLGHTGPTDVIAFQHGEIVISTERAAAQAGRFGTSVPEELARYLIHGLLHLAGHGDTRPAARRRMRRVERRLLQAARNTLDLRRLLR